jgi:hypothetical protein
VIAAKLYNTYFFENDRVIVKALPF